MSDFGKNILILSPHPDDEIVACCIAIKHAQKNGSKIYVIHLTNGCPSKDIMWPWKKHLYDKKVKIRKEEAISVAKKLGVEIVGFGNRPSRHLWQNLCEVKREIIDAISKFKIDQLWCPAYEGGHPDHDGINGMISSMRNNISILEFAEYNFCNGEVNSHKFPFTTGTEKIIEFTKEETLFKKECLNIYKSEKLNLNYVKTIRETYRNLHSYDYTKLPHEGTLWYKRFNWVPFPHPSIDRSKPINVCKVIGFFST